MYDADPTRPAHVSASETFRAARDLLLQHRTDYDTAVRAFRWPAFDHFNWGRWTGSM